jgi:hypothetical protein
MLEWLFPVLESAIQVKLQHLVQDEVTKLEASLLYLYKGRDVKDGAFLAKVIKDRLGGKKFTTSGDKTFSSKWLEESRIYEVFLPGNFYDMCELPTMARLDDLALAGMIKISPCDNINYRIGSLSGNTLADVTLFLQGYFDWIENPSMRSDIRSSQSANELYYRGVRHALRCLLFALCKKLNIPRQRIAQDRIYPAGRDSAHVNFSNIYFKNICPEVGTCNRLRVLFENLVEARLNQFRRSDNNDNRSDEQFYEDIFNAYFDKSVFGLKNDLVRSCGISATIKSVHKTKSGKTKITTKKVVRPPKDWSKLICLRPWEVNLGRDIFRAIEDKRLSH